ncbi:hypothetical protein SLS64_006023 [Diaporthe eres]|uniref:Uncharacterized protein n=1 Tax=Diaporthe eres TaxID=83184 RepID=A0ABR1NWW6_DIAER
MAVYFWVIWRLYLNPSNDANGLVFGRPGARAIYYSWFVIATIGLSLSQYGLESVEKTRVYQQVPAGSSVGPSKIKEHIDHTWARPDGWLRVSRRLVLRGDRPIRGPLRYWTLLAIVTAFGFVGLPLSGLAMDFETGYYSSVDNPSVAGFDNASWNLRFKADTWDKAYSEWNTGARMAIPGSGVVYSSPETDRSISSFLATLPNNLPEDSQAGTPDLFLAPQATTPIDGRSWGLALGFQCSVVNRISDFIILSHRAEDTKFSDSGSYTEYTVLGGDARIRVFNVSGNIDISAVNIEAVAEIGYDNVTKETSVTPAASECYNPIPLAGDKTMPYPGLDQPQALELVLWQNLSTSTPLETKPAFNLSLTDTIPDLLGAYNTTRGYSNESNPMQAIGIRCTSVSEVGMANLNGRLASFTDFRRSDTTSRNSGSGSQCVERLSLGVPNLVFANAVTGRDPAAWMTDFYSSVGKFRQSFAQQDYGPFTGSQVNIQSSYLQAAELRRSLTRAYSLYALELMYNSGVGYVDPNGTYVLGNFTNTEATGYAADTVLVPGVVPPALVAVLLTLWAVGSLTLSLTYGLRRSS